MSILRWKDYPKPRLRMNQGKWVVEVSYPASIRHMFGNGKGRSKKLTTGTTDKAKADQLVMEIGHSIYKLFDEKQIEYANSNKNTVDDFALEAIHEVVELFNYTDVNSTIPVLNEDTDYDVLFSMKKDIESHYQMAQNNMPEETPDLDLMVAKSIRINELMNSDEVSVEDINKIFAEIKGAMSHNSIVSFKQHSALIRHNSSIVQSYWQDLLTAAALKQGKTPPIFDELGSDSFDLSKVSTVWGEAIIPTKAVGLLGSNAKPISRQRRNKINSTKNILAFMDEYYAMLDMRYNKVDTKNKIKKGLRKFVKFMGDLPLQEVEPLTVYTFMDMQQKEKPTISARVIKDNNWACGVFFKFCIQKGHTKYNPFANIDLTRRGVSAENHLSYSLDDLHIIFNHNWMPQERLLLQILVTTGMRLTEVGNLTWERFHENFDGIQGLRCFSLIDTKEESVSVKNIGSKRIVALHNDLPLPQKTTGRLFDYKINADGLSSHDAGRAINPILKILVPHRLKSAHSFRGTLKIMLRNAGVSKEINDFYTGHSQGDVASTSYGGVAVDVRFEAINKVDHPWLRYKSNLD